jgi:hypothetical protein
MRQCRYATQLDATVVDQFEISAVEAPGFSPAK